MRLIELKHNVTLIRVPFSIYRELVAVELDTVDEYSPQSKMALADEMQRAQIQGNVVKIPFTNLSKQYLLNNAIPNLIDIATDKRDQGLINKLNKFHANLSNTVLEDFAKLSKLIKESVGGYQTLAIMPGRFSPPHIGHLRAWRWLDDTFDQAYIATSNNVDPPRSPFSFEEKHRLFEFAGVPGDRVIQTASPYRADEIVKKFDPNQTVLIFGVSQKDMDSDPRFSFAPKKDGSPGYLQSYEKHQNNIQPISKFGYVTVVPTFKFMVNGEPMRSATEFRQNFAAADSSTQRKMIQDLYGKYDPGIHQLLRSRIATN
jgi:hypothetical protein